MRRHRLPSIAAAPVACAVALGACIHPDLAAGVLTPDTDHPDDVYHLDIDAGGVIRASADAANTGGNTRWAFWRKADQPRVDQQICTTWVDGDIATSQQQGAALQIRKEGSRTRAITVTRHIYGGFGGQFNVHTMDSAPAGGGGPALTWFGAVTIDSLADETTPYPWRLCARIIGRQVSFIVWPLSDPQPPWGTPGAGGSATLPAGWDAASGIPGFFVGHLTAGQSVGFTDVVISAP
jgi:hypothetical protein